MVAHFRSIPSLGLFGGRPQFYTTESFLNMGTPTQAGIGLQRLLRVPTRSGICLSLCSIATSRAGVRALPLGVTSGHERLGGWWGEGGGRVRMGRERGPKASLAVLACVVL